MEYPFPEKYEKVARYFDTVIGDITTSERLSDEQKLMFYALRQQAEHGRCTDPAPSLWDFTARVKHQAWSRLGSMSPFEAMVLFVQQFEEFLGVRDVCWRDMIEGGASAQAAAGEGGASSPALAYDADVLEHQEPTADNIRYLSDALMAARRHVAALVASSQQRDTQTAAAAAAAAAPPPPLRESPLPQASSPVPAAPLPVAATPRAPPPPVKPTFAAMTQAAARSGDRGTPDPPSAWSWRTLL